MDRTERDELITQYRAGPDVLAAALEGMSDTDLDARPEADEWTAREIAHHTADSEMTSAIRVRRLVAEDNPTIAGYDEGGFARRLYYGHRRIAPSLDAVRACRATTADILDHLTEAQWQRAGTHSEMGAYSVEAWLRIYARHCHDHAEQVRRVRAAAAGTA